jgi:hypothetical protein
MPVPTEMTDELKKVYSSNVRATRVYDTVEISHSLFTQTYYLVQNNTSKTFTLDDVAETSQVFEPFGFSVVLPTKGSNQQDVGLVLQNVSQIIKELELAAENMSENIVLKYRPYIDGDSFQQAPTLELALTNVSADTYKITANASRVSLFDRSVPSVNFDSWVFSGIA